MRAMMLRNPCAGALCCKTSPGVEKDLPLPCLYSMGLSDCVSCPTSLSSSLTLSLLLETVVALLLQHRSGSFQSKLKVTTNQTTKPSLPIIKMWPEKKPSFRRKNSVCAGSYWQLSGIIYGGKNVKTARSDLKTVQNCQNS